MPRRGDDWDAPAAGGPPVHIWFKFNIVHQQQTHAERQRERPHSGDPRRGAMRDEAGQRTSQVRKEHEMAKRPLLDDVPLQWLLRICAYSIIVPREALLVALTSDVAVNVVSTNRRRLVVGPLRNGMPAGSQAAET